MSVEDAEGMSPREAKNWRARKKRREARKAARNERPRTFAEREAREKKLHREQQARWAKANPDKIARYMDAWEAKNPGLLRQYDRDRYAADPEKFKAKSRAYYERNKERINAERRAKTAAKRSLRKPVKKIGAAIMDPNRV